SLLMFLLYFFFSSRRRHTRSLRDWSSDVCSSDLSSRAGSGRGAVPIGTGRPARRTEPESSQRGTARTPPPATPGATPARRAAGRSEERRVGKEWRAWGAAGLEKKKRRR